MRERERERERKRERERRLAFELFLEAFLLPATCGSYMYVYFVNLGAHVLNVC